MKQLDKNDLDHFKSLIYLLDDEDDMPGALPHRLHHGGVTGTQGAGEPVVRGYLPG